MSLQCAMLDAIERVDGEGGDGDGSRRLRGQRRERTRQPETVGMAGRWVIPIMMYDV
jgi:hypothetical protein